MREIIELENELKSMLDNIDRLKKYVKDNKEYKPYSSRVFGELKHRGVVLKSTITRVNELGTHDLFFNAK